MPVMEEIGASLSKAERDLAGLRPLYEKDLQAKAVSADLRVEIKTILENQRSPLDYLARELVTRFGNATPGHKVYYPSCAQQTDFPSQINGRMPGVKDKRPDIAAAIERHQPFQPGHEWMKWL